MDDYNTTVADWVDPGLLLASYEMTGSAFVDMLLLSHWVPCSEAFG